MKCVGTECKFAKRVVKGDKAFYRCSYYGVNLSRVTNCKFIEHGYYVR